MLNNDDGDQLPYTAPPSGGVGYLFAFQLFCLIYILQILPKQDHAASSYLLLRTDSSQYKMFFVKCSRLNRLHLVLKPN